jgi:hypothetical protein
LKVADFSELIKVLPEQQQSFTIKKKNWESYFDKPYGPLLSSHFTSDEIEISRHDIFLTTDLDELIIKTLLWGYPAGMRGNNFSSIMKSLSELKGYLKKAEAGIRNWKAHDIKIPGLGLSTYSKLLFFIRAEVEGFPALILDQRIINAIGKKVFTDLEPTRNITYQNGWSTYPEYLGLINRIASDNDMPPRKS